MRPGTADTNPIPSLPGLLPGPRLSRNKSRGAVWPHEGNNNINHVDQGNYVCLSGQPAKPLWQGILPSGPQPQVQVSGFSVSYWEWNPSQGGHLPMTGLSDLERPVTIPVDSML